MIELFYKHKRAAAVQPTGTGKSFLILQLIADNPKKHFLIASSSAYIFKQLCLHVQAMPNLTKRQMLFIDDYNGKFRIKYEWSVGSKNA